MDCINLTAKRLRLCREESRETLEQIGQLTGVNKSTVMRWENGDTSKINLPTLSVLARHFRVNPEWLMGLTENREAPEEPASPTSVVPVPIMGSVRGLGSRVSPPRCTSGTTRTASWNRAGSCSVVFGSHWARHGLPEDLRAWQSPF